MPFMEIAGERLHPSKEKRNMKRTLPIFCAALLITGAALWAQPGFHKGGMMMHRGGFAAGIPQRAVDRLTTELDLTKEQQASWQALRDKQSATVKPLFEAGRAKREAIRDGLNNNADATTLGQLLIDAHKIGEQIRAAHDQYEKDFSALLNSDQLAKYQEIRQKFHRGPGDAPPPLGE
jgi:Spy/CpxP family protein refolding chaperone